MSCSVSLMLTLIWGNDILFEKLASEVGGWIWKALFANYVYRGGDFMKSLSFFLISLIVTCTLCLDYKALSELANYWSDSFRRCNLKGVCWSSMCQYKHEELVWPGGKRIAWRRDLSRGTVGGRKLCLVPFHICNIHGNWKSKEVGKGSHKVDRLIFYRGS